VLKDLYNMKKNIILLSIFAISFSFLAFNIDNIEKQWKKIERKVQKKGIEYVLTDKLVENVIDHYFESTGGVKNLTWSARDEAIIQYTSLSKKQYDEMAYNSNIGWHALSINEKPDYEVKGFSSWNLKHLKVVGFNQEKTIAIIYLRASIQKMAVSALNDQFLVEELYFEYKDFLVEKLQGKEKSVQRFLNIVNKYLNNEPLRKYDQEILARREAAGGRDLIVTYKVILEDLVASL